MACSSAVTATPTSSFAPPTSATTYEEPRAQRHHAHVLDVPDTGLTPEALALEPVAVLEGPAAAEKRRRRAEAKAHAAAGLERIARPEQTQPVVQSRRSSGRGDGGGPLGGYDASAEGNLADLMTRPRLAATHGPAWVRRSSSSGDFPATLGATHGPRLVTSHSDVGLVRRSSRGGQAGGLRPLRQAGRSPLPLDATTAASSLSAGSASSSRRGSAGSRRGPGERCGPE